MLYCLLLSLCCLFSVKCRFSLFYSTCSLLQCLDWTQWQCDNHCEACSLFIARSFYPFCHQRESTARNGQRRIKSAQFVCGQRVPCGRRHKSGRCSFFLKWCSQERIWIVHCTNCVSGASNDI